MKKFYGFLLAALAVVSCETDHSFRRELVNNSSYPLWLRYNYHHLDGDSLFYISQNDTLLLSEWWKLGSHTYADSCYLSDEDTIWIEVDSSLPLVFSSNLRDEIYWESEFVEGRSSQQVCRFVVDDADFVVK